LIEEDGEEEEEAKEKKRVLWEGGRSERGRGRGGRRYSGGK
jgi:hypothetical protein